MERDEYKCVICGKGIKDGVEIHIDHIKPKDFGGKATIENGQTLCAQHNFLKKISNKQKLVKRCLFGYMNLQKMKGMMNC